VTGETASGKRSESGSETRTRTMVVKVGSSTVTGADGSAIDVGAIERICAQIATLRSAGHRVVLVSSGAIAAGWTALGGGKRPTDLETLQAVSAIGQHRLMRVYDDAFAANGVTIGQVLLAPLDFVHRQQYLHARQTLTKLLELGVVPVVNENDATSDDEIRFGDNDRLAALVAHLVAADLLVMLTDTPGLLTADPRTTSDASLIEEVLEVDHRLEALAAGPRSVVGSGGMTSKLAAAKIAAWSGVETMIADAASPGVLTAAASGGERVGTVFRAHRRRLSARKLWIAFAVAPAGTLVVDDGARRAIVEREASLLPAGIVSVNGKFAEEAAVEIADQDKVVFAKGLVSHGSDQISALAGKRTHELPENVVHEVVHRDDLVVLV
jgi:glutamate 5-kinase